LKVKIQYFGYIKNMLNKREEHFELDEGASLSDLLNKLAGIHGAAFRKEVYEPGLKDVKMGFSVTVNGVLMGQLGGLDAKLSEGDIIILMSLMSGGQSL
jgi:molybdopterin converting factor small subunit